MAKEIISIFDFSRNIKPFHINSTFIFQKYREEFNICPLMLSCCHHKEKTEQPFKIQFVTGFILVLMTQSSSSNLSIIIWIIKFSSARNPYLWSFLVPADTEGLNKWKYAQNLRCVCPFWAHIRVYFALPSVYKLHLCRRVAQNGDEQ